MPQALDTARQRRQAELGAAALSRRHRPVSVVCARRRTSGAPGCGRAKVQRHRLAPVPPTPRRHPPPAPTHCAARYAPRAQRRVPAMRQRRRPLSRPSQERRRRAWSHAPGQSHARRRSGSTPARSGARRRRRAAQSAPSAPWAAAAACAAWQRARSLPASLRRQRAARTPRRRRAPCSRSTSAAHARQTRRAPAQAAQGPSPSRRATASHTCCARLPRHAAARQPS